MKKTNILLIGTFPGKIGGTTILVDLLYKTLRGDSAEWEITKIDTGKPVYSVVKDGALNKIYKSDIIIQNVSSNSFWYSYYLSLIFIILKKKVCIRFFGGDAHKLVFKRNKIPSLSKKIVILTETFSNINSFESNGFKAFQISNFRPVPNKEIRKVKPIVNKIIFIGQMKLAKGVKDTIELAKATPDIEYHFFGPLHWDVSEEDFENIENVAYKGIVPLGETVNLFDNYDALVFPSLYEGESHAGVVIEAFSVGLPVICYNWQAITEIVTNGVNGLVTSVNTSDGLIDAMDRFYGEINHALMRENCIQTFIKFHTPRIILQRHKDIVRYMIDSSTQEPSTSYLS